MTAQLANGGYKIYPKITINEKDKTAIEIKELMEEGQDFLSHLKINIPNFLIKKKI